MSNKYYDDDDKHDKIEFEITRIIGCEGSNVFNGPHIILEPSDTLSQQKHKTGKERIAYLKMITKNILYRKTNDK